MAASIFNDPRFQDEGAAFAYVENKLWPNGPVCPHCGSDKATKLQGKAHRTGLYKCQSCAQQYTATVNTILEDSHLPIRTWLMAFAILCSAKKGISALQLQRQLGLGSYRAAWHLCHRIRFAMSKEPLAGLLGAGGGIVEADECYVGGEPRKGSDKSNKPGRGTKKTPVVALVQRDGHARSFVVKDAKAKTLAQILGENVDRSATLMTDEWRPYIGIGKEFAKHERVSHGIGEYARRDGSHVNTAESYFALLQRGIVGSFHHVSPRHLGRYCDEFSFRWNHRQVSDSERTFEAIRGVEGRRLSYRVPISAPH